MEPSQLRDAALAIGLDDLKVAEPVRPSAPAALFALECGRRTRWLRREPRLELTSQQLELRAPALLAEPLVVSRDSVAVAAVDTRSREGGQTARFPYSHEYEWTQPSPGDQAETYGWLYVRGSRSPLPFLSDVRCLPNLVVVFAEPLAPLACRRRAPRAAPRPPVAGRPLPGFFARVRDAEAARLALQGWGVMRPLTVGDAERVDAAQSAPR